MQDGTEIKDNKKSKSEARLSIIATAAWMSHTRE